VATQPAIAEDGPLTGDPNLTVEGENYPVEVVWQKPRGVRHLYRFETVSQSGGGGGVPVYRFVRTLEENEPDPTGG
jgi:hypothetical protein